MPTTSTTRSDPWLARLHRYRRKGNRLVALIEALEREEHSFRGRLLTAAEEDELEQIVLRRDKAINAFRRLKRPKASS